MSAAEKNNGGLGPGLSLRHRVAIGGGALALLLAATTVLALATSSDTDTSPPQTASVIPTESAPGPSGSSTGPDGPTGPTGAPKTRDPVEFGKAFAARLWSYDTRTDTQTGHLASLHAWLTHEREYADPDSITNNIPDPVLWSRMRDGGQYATAEIGEGHIPASFTAALNADPGRITDVYAYAVTVTGKQSIRWNGSGAGAEARTVTLAVQCRPNQDCALAGVLPNIAP
ncbi:hypothetical protein [Streptomyces sp. SID3343]|uniref:hypothetical protein n=1 Tax=Streptomyces sp. SID3343 TaxID=2690260 RepID=UPI001370C93E|nr:hypothetical protein [Streptomyces sp. SID3343]MYV97299.1 hypothetical protein [Streptomyces sp. SID3343]